MDIWPMQVPDIVRGAFHKLVCNKSVVLGIVVDFIQGETKCLEVK